MTTAVDTSVLIAIAKGEADAEAWVELLIVARAEGELVVCDEVLTPDSSRFWPADEWKPGITPPSFDKQPLRDYLDGLDWDKSPPPPPLPDEVVGATSARYRDAYERITGKSLDDWPGA